MEHNTLLTSKLSMHSDVPLYVQLVNIIKRSISTGAIRPGELLPSEAELCRNFEISRSTVRQAIGDLEADGIVIRKQGRGTFVAEPKQRRRAENVYSFTSEINALGMSPSSTMLQFEITYPNKEIAEQLELTNINAQVYRFTRVRKVDGQPLILETSYYPTYIYPRLTRKLLETHSFYSLLFEEGIVPNSAVDNYEAVRMTEEEAEALGCKNGDAAFSVKRRTRTDTGTVYELTHSIVRGDRVSLYVGLQKDGVSFHRSIDKR